MKILVSNIGSTSFKFRLLDMTRTGKQAGERELASGGADRIGQEGGMLKFSMHAGVPCGAKGKAADVPSAAKCTSVACDFADHGAAIRRVLDELVKAGVLADLKDLGAVAFKAVMAGDCDPICIVDDALLERMEYFVPIAPAHNPSYIAAMRMFRKALPGVPLVAAFEPGFHRTIPERRRLYAVPPQWASRYGVKRYGYHGASHCYVATRVRELMNQSSSSRPHSSTSAVPTALARNAAEAPSTGSAGLLSVVPPAQESVSRRDTVRIAQQFTAGEGCPDQPSPVGTTEETGQQAHEARHPELRIISCHLGGSSSICAIRGGKSVANSFGLSPQSGLPQTNRAGEFDPFAFSLLQRAAGLSVEQVLKALGKDGGLAAIKAGSPQASLALDVFVTAVRDCIGAYLVELGGCDVLAFTGGIGQHNPSVREEICRGLAFAGMELDAAKNNAADGNAETRIEAAASKTTVYVLPTNEELIVARQAVDLLKRQGESHG